MDAGARAVGAERVHQRAAAPRWRQSADAEVVQKQLAVIGSTCAVRAPTTSPSVRAA